MAVSMKSRCCSDSNSENYRLFNDIAALDAVRMKTGDTFHGKRQMRADRHFSVNKKEAIKKLRDFTENVQVVPENLKPLLRTVSTLPYSTAECEHGFSIMNNVVTDLRASVLVYNVCSLMFKNSKAPLIEQSHPERYVSHVKPAPLAR
jgi:hypothetical protein